MDLLKRELFDIYVYGTAQPHFDGRCAGTNKYFSKNEEAVADKELRTFAQQIIEMCQLPEYSFLDSMLRIKGVFASDIEHDYALDYDS